MGTAKDEINQRLGRLVDDKQIEINERLDEIREDLGLDDEEMRQYLAGWEIDLRDGWIDFVQENQ
jgi:hypothetical protein